jgi:hypothetical protein
VVLDNIHFSSDPADQLPVNGTIFVHEIGHWLGLFHTFEGGCEPGPAHYVGDRVADTPAHRNEWVEAGADTCPDLPGKDPLNNFMAYRYDPPLQFTPGQVDRMREQWAQYRAAPAPGTPDPDEILSGKRQVAIRVLPDPEAILAVDDKGRLDATDGGTDKGLFVLQPVGGGYQIKTARTDGSGEPSCMGLRHSTDTRPDTIVAAACDLRARGQVFTIREREQTDGAGRPTYAILARDDAFLQVSSTWGLYAQPLGDSPLTTTFAFIDNGPATLPTLGD